MLGSRSTHSQQKSISSRTTTNRRELNGPKSLDMLGAKFSLGYPTPNGTFQTSLGGYVTIILGMITMSAFVLIFAQYFNKDSPVVTTSSGSLKGGSKFNFFAEGLINPISLTSSKGGLKLNYSRLVTIKAVVRSFRLNKSTSSLDQKLEHEFDFKPCGELEDSADLVEEAKTKLRAPEMIGANLCPDLKAIREQFYASETQSGSEYRTISIIVYPCSLEDQTQCAGRDEVDSVLLTSSRLTKLLAPSNLTNPVSFATGEETVKLDSASTKFRSYELKRTRVQDRGLRVSKPSIRAEFVTTELSSLDSSSRDPGSTHCSKMSIKTSNGGGYGVKCQEYVKFEYFATKQVKTVQRSYRTIISVLGEFGGFIKLLTTFGVFLYSMYRSGKVSSFMARAVFGFDKDRKTELSELLEQDDERNMGRIDSQTRAGATPDRFVRMEDVVKDSIRERSDALSYMENMNFIELLKEVLLGEDEKRLLPLALLKNRQKRLQGDLQVNAAKGLSKRGSKSRLDSAKKQKSSENFNSKIESQISEHTHKKSTFSRANKVWAVPLEKCKTTLSPEAHSPLKDAFESVLNSEPEGPIKQKIRSFLLNNTHEFFHIDSSSLQQKIGSGSSSRLKSPSKFKGSVLNRGKTGSDKKIDSSPEKKYDKIKLNFIDGDELSDIASSFQGFNSPDLSKSRRCSIGLGNNGNVKNPKFLKMTQFFHNKSKNKRKRNPKLKSWYRNTKGEGQEGDGAVSVNRAVFCRRMSEQMELDLQGPVSVARSGGSIEGSPQKQEV